MSKSIEQTKGKDIIDTVFEYINNDNKVKIEADRLEGVKGFMKKGIEYGVSLNERDGLGNTFLHSAVKNSRTEIAKYLIESKADLTLVNKKSENILHIASLRKNTDFIKYLIDNNKITLDKTATDKIYINAEDNFKYTALKIAKTLECSDIVELLENNFADITSCEEELKSPFKEDLEKVEEKENSAENIQHDDTIEKNPIDSIKPQEINHPDHNTLSDLAIIERYVPAGDNSNIYDYDHTS